MTSTATEATSSHESRRLYQEVIFLYTRKRRRWSGAAAISDAKNLFDVVDLRQNLLGADFLGVVGHHRVHQLLHLRAVGERHALELALFLELDQLLLVLARLDLAAVG